MLQWALDGARQFDWIVAKRQVAGRGRMGRQWQSPEGNLYASTLLRLRDGDPPAPTLALVAAIAAHHTAKSLIWPEKADAPWSGARIKWPNDILYNGSKLAGVLLERVDQAVIIGIGINLAWSPEEVDRPATSIQQIGTDLLVTPSSAFALLQRYFRTAALNWRSREQGGLEWVRQAWLQCAHPVGTPLLVRTGSGQEYSGTFAGLSPECALLLKTDDGMEATIHAGDVFLI